MPKTRYLVILVILLVLSVATLYWGRTSDTSTINTPAPTATSENLFPTGDTRPNTGSVASAPTATSTEADNPDAQLSDKSGRFWRVSGKPVGGSIVLGNASSSALVYVERATGHIYRFSPDAGGSTRISNTTIPKVYTLNGTQAGTSTKLALQYLKDNQIQTFVGSFNLARDLSGDDFILPKSTLETKVGESEFLSPNIRTIAAKGGQFFWLETSGNNTTGYLSALGGSKKEAIWRSSQPEWEVSWVGTSTIALLSSPSINASGSLYLLNLKTKQANPVITGVKGLTALVSPKLDQVFYGGQTTRGLTSGFYDVKKRFFAQTSLQTWADKCVWNQLGTQIYCAVPTNLPPAQYPDDWYRGEVNTSDNIWLLDPVTGRNEIVFNPSQSGLNLSLDAENLLLDSNNHTLYLTDRATQQLWSLNLQSDFATDESQTTRAQ